MMPDPGTPCTTGASEATGARPLLVDVTHAARMLSCSEAAVRKWIYQRKLPIVKIGRLTRLRVADLERLVAEGFRQARPSLN